MEIDDEEEENQEEDNKEDEIQEQVSEEDENQGTNANEAKRLLNHNSDNTGIPTSKTKIGDKKRIPNTREKSNKEKGGQLGHEKHKLKKFNDNEITDTYTYEIANPICKCCGGKLELTGKRCKDDFDIEIRLVKRRNVFRSLYHIIVCNLLFFICQVSLSVTRICLRLPIL